MTGREAEAVARAAIDAHLAVVGEAAALVATTAATVAEAVLGVVDLGGTVFAAGNGGSASDAQHFVAELVGRYRDDRRPVAAVVLGADAASLTAIANDTGFDQVFSRPMEALGSPGDLLFAISTSGRSPNVVAAAAAARRVGCTVVCLTGADGGDLATLGDVVLRVPSDATARIQEVHGLFLHTVAEIVETELRRRGPG